jgi:hypothetical protein
MNLGGAAVGLEAHAMRSYLLPLLALILLALAGPVLAVDGVLEINQTCATQTGCFAGDALGFPVTIDSAGSYVLTSSLSVASATVDGVHITTGSVAIDLNGFEIVGPTACTGSDSTLSCPGAAAGFHGIDAGTNDRVEVHSGRLRGFPDHGLTADLHVRLHDLHVEQNGLGGIQVGDYAEVRDTTAALNGGDGIVTGSASVLERLIARGNLRIGIVCNNGCTVRGSSAFLNGAHGIQVAFGSLVSEISSYLNDGDGVQLNGNSFLREANVYRNGSDVQFQIRALGAFAVFQNCTLSAVAGQGAFSTAVNGGENYCDGAPCP